MLSFFRMRKDKKDSKKSSQKEGRRRLDGLFSRNLRIESLEDRQLLSISPTIGAITINKDFASSGETVEISVSGLADADSTTTGVFAGIYDDTNNNGIYDSGDTPLGSGEAVDGAYSLTTSFLNSSDVGQTHTILAFAISQNENGSYEEGDAISTALNVVPTGYTAVSDLDELKAILNNPSGKYILTQDISISLRSDLTSLGVFSGILDGNGHAIIFSVSDSAVSASGLFESITANGIVRNLGLENVDVSCANSVGALAASSLGTVTNCHVTGSVSTYNDGYYYGNAPDKIATGMLIGSNCGTISGCWASGTVIGLESAGGLVGENSGSLAKITDSHANVAVSLIQISENVNWWRYTSGGFVGSNYGGAIITDSYATGDIKEYGGNGGGFVGSNYGGAVITDSYATGELENCGGAGGGFVAINGGEGGGLISRCYATGSVQEGYSFSGGFAGKNVDGGYLTDCYSTGTVGGMDYAGGFVGVNGKGIVTAGGAFIDNCYSTGSATGCAGGAGGFVAVNYYAACITNSFCTGNVFFYGSFGQAFIGCNITQGIGKIADCYYNATMTSNGLPATNSVAGVSAAALSDLYSSDSDIYDTWSSAVWSFSNSSAPLLIKANDVAENAAPVAYNLTADKDWVKQTSDDSVALTFSGFDDKKIVKVLFYNDANGDGVPTASELLGMDAAGSDGWKLTVKGTSFSTTGSRKIMAIAVDESGAMSSIVSTKLSVFSSDYTAISTANQLLTLTSLGQYFLTGNIDLAAAGITNFTPIASFAGTFDGNGHVISSLAINRTASFTGLFAEVVSGGVVKNLGLTNANVIGGLKTGGLVGQCDAGAQIINCYVQGSVSASANYVGGLVGYNCGTVSKCYTTGTVTTSASWSGGLIGYSTGTSAVVSLSYSSTSVSGNYYVGGFIGSNAAAATVINSYAAGNVNGSLYIGGFIGSSGPGTAGTISECYASGNVAGTGSSVGGFIGYCSSGTITYCFAIGNVTGTASSASIGAFIGLKSTGTTVSNCVYNSAAVITNHGTGGTSAITGATETTLAALASLYAYENGVYDAWRINSANSNNTLGGWCDPAADWYIKDGLPHLCSVESKTSEAPTIGTFTQSKDWLVYSNNDSITLSVDGVTAGDADIAEVRFCYINSSGYLNWFNGIQSGSDSFSFPIYGSNLTAGTYTIYAVAYDVAGNASEAKAVTITVYPAGYTAVSTVEQLQAIQNNLGGNYFLTCDIDASATALWNYDSTTGTYLGFTPIGYGSYFSGTLDGNGYVISNLHINRSVITSANAVSNEIALFSRNFGVISNLGVENAYISGDTTVSVVVGTNFGTVKSCYSTGTVIGHSYDPNGCACIGGLVGNNYGTTQSSWSSANVTNIGTASLVGGLIGRNQGLIETCYSTGDVTAQNYVGGFVGGNLSTISNCYATGDVTGTGIGVGGFIGNNYSSGSADNCYASGGVSGAYYLGGFIGKLESGSSVTDCFSLGDVTGTASNSLIGSFAGGSSGTITNCNYLNVAAITNNGVGGVNHSFADFVALDSLASNMAAVYTRSGNEWNFSGASASWTLAGLPRLNAFGEVDDNLPSYVAITGVEFLTDFDSSRCFVNYNISGVASSSIRIDAFIVWSDGSTHPYWSTSNTYGVSVGSHFNENIPWWVGNVPIGDYDFLFQITNGKSTSSYSSHVYSPQTPTNLVATQSTVTEVTLSWTLPSGNGSSPSPNAYIVESSVDGTNFTIVSQIFDAPNLTSCAIATSDAKFFRIRACDYSTCSRSSSDYSNVASLSAKVELANFSYSGESGLYSLDYQVSNKASGPIMINVYRSANGVSTGEILDSFVISDSSLLSMGSHTVTFAPAANIDSVDGALIATISNGQTNAQATTNVVAQPTSLAVTATSTSVIHLVWTDQSNGESGFEIQRSLNGVDWTPLISRPANTLSYDDQNLTEGTKYYYRVRATSATENSAYCVSGYAATSLKTPSDLRVTSISANQVGLQWTDNSANETQYVIEQLIDGTWTSIGVAASATTATISRTFVVGAQYAFRVRAVNNVATSLPSNEFSVTAAWPSAPSGLTVTAASDSRIDLTWQDNSGNETGFLIQRSEDGISWTTLQNVAANSVSCSDSLNLTEGKRYYYQVKALAAAPNADSSFCAAQSAVTFLAAPSNLAVVSISADSVTLSWHDASNQETKYVAELFVNGVWTQIGGDLSAVTAATHIGQATIASAFEFGKTYKFRVTAKSAVVSSAPSNEATVTATWAVAPQLSIKSTLSSSNALQLNGSIVDPDSNSWTLMVNYGDGIEHSVTYDANHSFSLNPVFSQPGSYRITITVNDGTSASVSSTLEFVKVSSDTLGNISIGKEWVFALDGEFNLNGSICGEGDVEIKAGGLLKVNHSDPVTVASDIIGAGGVEVDSSAVFTGTNTYVGGTYISGTLQIGDGGSAGSIIGNVTGSGKLIFNLNNGNVFDGVIAINMNVEIAKGSTLRLGANAVLPTNDLDTNTSCETTVYVYGTLDLNGHSVSIGNLSGDGFITSNAKGLCTLTVLFGDSFYGVINDGSGSDERLALNVGQYGMKLYSNNSYSGGTTISSGGTLTLSKTDYYDSNNDHFYTSGGTLGLGDVNIETGAKLAVSGLGFDAPVVIRNKISGEGSVEIGYSTVFTGTNDYKGGTYISGTLQIGDGGSAGSIVGSVTGGGKLIFNLNDGNEFNGAVGIYLQVEIAKGSSLRLGAKAVLPNAYSRAGTVCVYGTLDLNGHSVSIWNLTGDGVITSNAKGLCTLTVLFGDSFYGVINDGSGSDERLALNVGQDGMKLYSNNSYSGGTTISSGGTLTLSKTDYSDSNNNHFYTSGGTLGLGDVNIETGAKLAVSGLGFDAAVVIRNKISGGGSVDIGYSTVFTGTNTYTGGTYISGTLQIGDGGSAGSIIGNVKGIGTLIFNRSDNITFSYLISGSLNLVQQGAGVLTLTGNNNYSGTTTISRGTISVSNIIVSGGSSNLGNATSAIVLGDDSHQGVLAYTGNSVTLTRTFSINAGGGEINVTTYGTTLDSNDIDGSGSARLTKSGAGALSLAVNNRFTGDIKITGGTLVLGCANALANSVLDYDSYGGNLSFGTQTSVTLGGLKGGQALALRNDNNAAVSLTVGNLTSTTYSGVLSGAGSLTKTGAGNLTLSGNNTFTGTTKINQGKLIVGHANALANSTLDFSYYGGTQLLLFAVNSANIGSLQGSMNFSLTNIAGGAVALSVGSLGLSSSYSGYISGTGSLTKEGNGTLTLSKYDSYSGATTMNAGALVLKSTLSGGAVINGGTMTLVGALSGGAVINGGTLQVGDGTTNGTISGSIVNNAQLIFVTASSTQYYNGVISGTGTLTKTGSGTLILCGSVNCGVTTISQGTLQIGDGTTNGTISGPIVNNSALTFLTAALTTQTYGGVITGSGATTKSGSGTLTLSGNNAYTGLTTMNAGALFLNGALSGGAVINGGTMTLVGALSGGAVINGGTMTLVGALSGGAVINGGTLQVGDGTTNGSISGPIVNNSSLTFLTAALTTQTYGGVITGSGATTKSGSGTLTLSGNNAYSGATTMNAGALFLYGTLSGGAVINGGTMTLVGALSGGAVINGGTLQVGDGTTNGSISGPIVNNSALTFLTATSTTQTYGGVITGSGATTKSGSGTLTLSGNNAYTGVTTMNAGALFLYGTLSGRAVINGGTMTLVGALSGGAVINGGTLQIGDGTTNGSISGPIVNNSALTFLTATLTTQTFGGVITGSGATTKSGSGTLTLSGNNAYTGLTTMNAGALFLNGALSGGAVINGGTMTLVGALSGGAVINGGTMQVGDGTTNGSISGPIVNNSALTFLTATLTTQTFGGVITGSGATTKSGSGTLTLSGNNAYTGATTISLGTLCVTGSITDSAVTVASGATLSGTGTVGEVTVNGTIAPGVGGVGTLNVGNLTFESGSRYYADLTTGGYDQINVTETANLSNAALSINSSRPDIAGDVLVLVKNAGVNAAGAFLNLSEGAAVTVSSSKYLITYCYNAETGEFGAGNDVALMNVRLAAPSDLQATTASNSEIDLTWTKNSTFAKGYVIERTTNDTVWTPIGSTTGNNSTSFSDSELTEGKVYYYRVRATFDSYQSDACDMVYAITLPAAPTGLAVSFVNGGQANLIWQDHSAVEVGYSVEQLVDGQWLQVQTTTSGTGAISAALTGTFDPTVSYSFRVLAYLNDFTAAPVYSLPTIASKTTPAWPAVPTDLAVTAVSDAEIDLKWTAASGATEYKIERSADGLSDWRQIGTTANNYYNDSSITEGEGTLRYYRVLATKTNEGDSAFTNVTSATTLPAKPASVQITELDGGHVTLAWSDTSNIESGYVIEQKQSDGSWLAIQTTNANAENVSIEGDFVSTTCYTFRVRAFKIYPDYCDYSLAEEASAATLSVPAAPTGLSATVVSASTIDLRWTNAATNETGYEIWRCTVGGSWNLRSTELPDTTYFHDTELSDGVAYSYRVRAINLVGNSAYIYASAVTPILAPSAVNITATSGSQMTVRWSGVSGNETGYSVFQFIDGDWQQVAIAEKDATSQVIAGTFNPATEYAFAVAAFNQFTTSSLAEGSVTTERWPVAPSNLSVVSASNSSISLIWTGSANATGYTIEQKEAGSAVWTFAGTALAASPSFSAINLKSGGTQYSFRVYATGTYGNSDYSNLAVGQTQNQAPSVTESPYADEDTVTTTDTILHVSATDDGGSDGLTYTWSVSPSENGGDVFFDASNRSNGAADIQVTFTAAGNYTFQVTISDAHGRFVTSSSLHVTVNQTLTSIEVTPGDAAITRGDTKQFTATGIDQFGDEMQLDDVTWSVSGGGSISNGLYTSTTTGDEATYAITATFGEKTGTANIAVKKRVGFCENVSVYAGAYDEMWWPNFPTSTKDVDLSNYHQVTRIELTNLDYAGLDYHIVSFDTPSGHVVIDFTKMAAGTFVTDLGSAVFNGGIITKDYNPNLVVYRPPGGWEAPFSIVFSQPVENLHFTTAAINTPEGERFAIVSVYSFAPRLLELTAADHTAPSNQTTAIDAVIKDLYVAEDQSTKSATIDFSSLLPPCDDDMKKEIHLSIKRSDGLVLFDNDLIHLNNSTETLKVTDTARDWVLKEWFDANGNGVLDAGDDVREIKVHVFKAEADLNIDSDNNDGYGKPDHSDQEEYLEDNPYGLGKLILPNWEDTNGDQVLDCWDGYYNDDYSGHQGASASCNFSQITITLPEGIDYNTAEIELIYSLASPTPTRAGSIYFTSSLYQSGKGAIRIWTKNGMASRIGTSVNDGGDLVCPNVRILASSLGFNATNRTVTLYVEGVIQNNGSRNYSQVLGGAVRPTDSIKLEVYPLGRNSDLVIKDTVNYIVADEKSFYYQLLAHEELRAALASDAVYGPTDMQKYCMQLITDEGQLTTLGFTQEQTQLLLHGDSSSGFYAGIYHDYISGKNILVFRGTEPLTVPDWENNFQQSVGQQAAQYAHAMDLAKALADFTKSSLSSTCTATMPSGWLVAGHSLGGGLASAASLISNVRADTFNAAGLNLKTITDFDPTLNSLQYNDNLFKNWAESLITAYVVDWDLLDFLQKKWRAPTAVGKRVTLNSHFGYSGAFHRLEMHSYYIESLLLSYNFDLE